MYDPRKMKLVIVLCAFIGHVYSAPSPCIDLCNPIGDSTVKQSESLQSYRAQNTFTDQNALRDLHQSLINELHNTHKVDLASTRPGNWTEHNDYVTDNGGGSIHEERGQLVGDASRVNYYKKNYASSYGTDVTGINNNAATSSLLNDYSNTHSTIDRSNTQNYHNQQHNLHSINHSSRGSSSIDNLSRLENLGEQTDTQIHDNSDSGIVSNTGDNWTRHNTYATDDGRGKVYEEEGQYNRGPAKVRYYKKNYTSTFSTRNGDSVIPNIPLVTIPNINTHIDAQLDELKSQLEQVNSHINQQTHHLSTNIDDLSLHRQTNDEQYRSRNHIINKQNVPAVDRVAVTQGQYHEKYSSSQNKHDINTHNNYGQVNPLPSQNQYIAPITHVTSTNTHHQVEKQVYVPTSSINSQLNSHSNHQQHHNEDTTIRIPIYRRNDGIHINDDSSISYLQNQQLNTNDNRHENSYNQHFEQIAAVQPQIDRHVEQHWSASEHRTHSTIPQQRIVVGSHQGITNDQNLDLLSQQQQRQYGSSTRDGYDNVNHANSNNYISGSSSSHRQVYGTEIHRGNVHSETLHNGYHGADCDDATHIEYNPQHGRIRYKREADYSRRDGDLSQQTDETFGKLELGQQTENNYNHNHDNSQRTQRYHDVQQTNRHNDFADYTQQHTENLELDQQQSTRGFEDFSQQHVGNLELGQHHEELTQQSARGFEDLTQQHTGNLQLDQQHTHQYQDGTQRRQHEFGDFIQQQSGNLELDQQHQSQHEFGDFTQHSENLELDQQHQNQYGKLEFAQQTENHGQYNQFNSQQHGKPQINEHNYEPQTQGNYYNNHGQQTLDLSQQTQHDQSLIEQSSGRNHFGQQHSDDLTQQTRNIGDYSQQTFGNLEYGQQQVQNNDDLSHITERNNYGLSKPAPKPAPRSQRIGQYLHGDTEIEPTLSPIGVKGGRRRGPEHYGEFNSHYSQSSDKNSEGVLTLEQQIKKDESINVFQPRILEAYGGNGPYDVNHNENIYTDIKPNPTATLAPIVDGKDPWDVRQVTTNDFFPKNVEAESVITETSTKLYPDDFVTTVAPGFWKKLGHKITSTYEKAKDKVSDVFG